MLWMQEDGNPAVDTEPIQGTLYIDAWMGYQSKHHAHGSTHMFTPRGQFSIVSLPTGMFCENGRKTVNMKLYTDRSWPWSCETAPPCPCVWTMWLIIPKNKRWIILYSLKVWKCAAGSETVLEWISNEHEMISATFCIVHYVCEIECMV